MIVKVEEGQIVVTRLVMKKHRALHGLTRSLIFNMVEGVTNGCKEFKLVVLVIGSASGNKLVLQVGYSHPVVNQVNI